MAKWSFNNGVTQLVAREIALLRLLGRSRRHASLQVLLARGVSAHGNVSNFGRFFIA
jgi:hypothetical protein